MKKNRFFVGLYLVLAASFISACANRTPEKAAARGALEQTSSGLDQPQTQPSADSNSVAVAAQPGESKTSVTDTTTTGAATSETAPAAAPAKVAPAGGAPVLETPAASTTTQAAALAALEQKMYELDHPETQSSTDTNSVAVPPAKSATDATGTVTTKAATQQTASAAQTWRPLRPRKLPLPSRLKLRPVPFPLLRLRLRLVPPMKLPPLPLLQLKLQWRKRRLIPILRLKPRRQQLQRLLLSPLRRIWPPPAPPWNKKYTSWTTRQPSHQRIQIPRR